VDGALLLGEPQLPPSFPLPPLQYTPLLPASISTPTYMVGMAGVAVDGEELPFDPEMVSREWGGVFGWGEQEVNSRLAVSRQAGLLCCLPALLMRERSKMAEPMGTPGTSPCL